MIKGLIISFFTCLLIFFLFFESIYEERIAEWFLQTKEKTEVVVESEEITAPNVFDEDLYVGLSVKEIKETFGPPARKDSSAYGYEWWIYPEIADYYLQIGIEDEKVVTTFKMEKKSNVTYTQLKERYGFKEEIEVKDHNGSFTFELNEEDLTVRPLVKLDDVYVQFYFDTKTDLLSSVRVMNSQTLLKHRPYSVSYKGALPELPSLSESDWRFIEEGEAKQIFTLTNIIRDRHDLPPLQWADDVADIAYLHSKEMSEEDYFSHESPFVGDLQKRLEKGDVTFRMAGENIAAQYVDGLASVEGWLNSEGHRVNLLHTDFTHLGVGVYHRFYTQNFLIPLKHY